MHSCSLFIPFHQFFRRRFLCGTVLTNLTNWQKCRAKNRSIFQICISVLQSLFLFCTSVSSNFTLYKGIVCEALLMRRKKKAFFTQTLPLNGVVTGPSAPCLSSLLLPQSTRLKLHPEPFSYQPSNSLFLCLYGLLVVLLCAQGFFVPRKLRLTYRAMASLLLLFPRPNCH